MNMTFIIHVKLYWKIAISVFTLYRTQKFEHAKIDTYTTDEKYWVVTPSKNCCTGTVDQVCNTWYCLWSSDKVTKAIVAKGEVLAWLKIDTINCSPKKYVRQLSAETNTPKSFVHRILGTELHAFTFKSTHKLNPDQNHKWLDFARCFLRTRWRVVEKVETDGDFLKTTSHEWWMLHSFFWVIEDVFVSWLS